MILSVVEGELLSGFSVREANFVSLLISHLLFVDDTLILYGASSDQIRTWSLLLCFEAVMRLKVNLAKSKIVPLGNISNSEHGYIILECKIFQLSMKYMDLPLGAPFKSKYIWNAILEKIEQKLFSWKKMYLSKSSIIKSTLSNNQSTIYH